MTAVQGVPRSANEGQALGWTVDDSEFGARLALVRQRMQWNIKEAATNCGIPPASWASWESGSMPRRYMEMCRLIADRTGADLTWLAMGSSTRRGGDAAINQHSSTVGRSDDPKRVRHLTTRPFGPSRRDRNRPVSGVPATRRRPSPVRPGERAIAV